mmetsp:Transcript_34941/g.71302  ORF Transcript_34941/g.71302 Transcript_34941/m.71302 type:complete len:437 (+) Transcript_34941:80-1390(+)
MILKYLCACFFSFLGIAAGKKSFLTEDPYYAKTLSGISFDQELKKDGDLFVMFHAPWCEHCEALSHAFEEAAMMLAQKEVGLKVTLAKVDGSKHEDLAKRYGVQGYPTLRYFKEREVQVMDAANSGGTAEDIYNFVKKVASAPDRIVHIVDEAGMDIFLETGGVFSIGFFESEEHAELFIGVAEKFKYPVRFGWTANGELAAARLGLDKNEETNRVVLLTPFDEKRHVFTVENPLEGTRKSRKDMANMMNTMMGVPHEEAEKLIPDTQEQRALKEWITTLMAPLVVPFEQGYTDLIFQGPVRAHLIAIIDPEADSSDIIAALTEASRPNRGKVLHIVMPAIEQTKDIRKFFGVEQHNLPTVVFSDMRHATDEAPAGTQTIFNKHTAITGDSLKEFADGQLEKSPGDQKKNRPSKKAARKKADPRKKKGTMPQAAEL